MSNGRWPFTAHGDLTHFILCILFDILYMQCITCIQPYLICSITVLLSLSVKRWSYPYPIKNLDIIFFQLKGIVLKYPLCKSNPDCAFVPNYACICARLQHAKRHTLLYKILALPITCSLLAFSFGRQRASGITGSSPEQQNVKPSYNKLPDGWFAFFPTVL